jgi:hypothetical protein
MSFFWLCANAMAGFADFATGALLCALVYLWFDAALLPWQFLIAIALGGVICFSPDFDIVPRILGQYWTGMKMTGLHHESVFHWPIPDIIVGGIVGYVLGGWAWAMIAALCLCAHYIHDAVFMGRDGLAWFFRLHRLFWTRRGIPDPYYVDHNSWIAERWLKPSWHSMLEIAYGSVALGLAVTIAAGSNQAGILTLVMTWVGALIVWVGYPLFSEK